MHRSILVRSGVLVLLTLNLPSVAQVVQSGVQPMQLGETVGELEVELPSADTFVLRGTLPLPPNSSQPGSNPSIRLRDSDGTLIPQTQFEVVSRYANGAADVVEILGRVTRPPGASTDDRQRYELVRLNGQAAPDPGTPDITDLYTATSSVPLSVQDLINNPFSVIISARDANGNTYLAFPFQGSGGIEVERYGAAMSSVRTFEPMMLFTGSADPYPHLFHVHSYIHTLADEELLLFDFRFSNGATDYDGSTAGVEDDSLGKFYFEEIELLVQQDLDVNLQTAWVAQPLAEDPAAFQFSSGELPGTLSSPFGGVFFRYPIVRPMPDLDPSQPNAVHMMPCKGQFTRRWVLSRNADAGKAGEIVDAYGQGFCVEGTNQAGKEYWSWWNAQTARYFPQKVQISNLDFESANYAGIDYDPQTPWKRSVRGTLDEWHDDLETALEDEAALVFPDYGSPEQLGWARPLGVPYGGETGGAGIRFLEGERCLAGRHRKGYRYLLLSHRMHTDRQPNSLYASDGSPTTQEDWLVGASNCSFCPPDAGGTPSYSQVGFYMDIQTDVFCTGAGPWTQNDDVVQNGRQPLYDLNATGNLNLNEYDPHDLQHLSRYSSEAKALVWIGNDPLARDAIEQQAELFRFQFTEFPLSATLDNFTEASLRQLQCWGANLPGLGSPIGRAEGWGVDVVNSTFSTGDDAYRARIMPWLDQVVTMMDAVQIVTTDSTFTNATTGQPYTVGMFKGFLSNKLFGDSIGDPRGTQTFEEGILANAGEGLLESVYLGTDPLKPVIQGFVEPSYHQPIWPLTWDTVNDVPFSIVPVTSYYPNDCDTMTPPNLTIFTLATMPLPDERKDSSRPDFWARMAYGLRETGDPVFESFGTLAAGGLCNSPLPAGCTAELIAALQTGSPMKPGDRSEWSNKNMLLGLVE